jgi:hypothetical protein
MSLQFRHDAIETVSKDVRFQVPAQPVDALTALCLLEPATGVRWTHLSLNPKLWSEPR